MTMEKNNPTPTAAPANEKKPAAAFVNWTAKVGKYTVRSGRGFRIQQNPQYPNKQEDILVAMAKKHLAKTGKVLELDMKVRIWINNTDTEPDVDTLLAELGHTADHVEEAAAV